MPHLVRVPTRFLVLVEQMLLAKLPGVPIQHRTHSKGRVAAWRGAEHRGEARLLPGSPPPHHRFPHFGLPLRDSTPGQGPRPPLPAPVHTPPLPGALTCSLSLDKPKSGSSRFHEASQDSELGSVQVRIQAARARPCSRLKISASSPAAGHKIRHWPVSPGLNVALTNQPLAGKAWSFGDTANDPRPGLSQWVQGR